MGTNEAILAYYKEQGKEVFSISWIVSYDAFDIVFKDGTIEILPGQELWYWLHPPKETEDEIL